MEKKENKIILFTTIGIIGAIIIVLGVTYAYWRLTKEQTGVNIVNSACLNVTMENQANDINIPKAYPISDGEGLDLNPFTFTVKNNCEEYADYTISLEMLTITNLNSDFVKIALNEQGKKGTPKILGSYDDYEDLKLEDTKEGRTITSGKLEPNGEKNYELRIWLDGGVEVTDDAMNKTYKSKVVIESTIGSEPVKTPIVEYLTNLEKKEVLKEEPELMYDDTKDGNLRYVGANPNNYIDIGDRYKSDIYDFHWTEDDYFDGAEYCSIEECESDNEEGILNGYGSCEKVHNNGDIILWRIIGVMKNVTVVDGEEKQEDLVKIIREDSIGYFNWDSSDGGNFWLNIPGVNDGNGINEWSQANLMKLLNPESVYTKDGEIGNSLYWNNESGQCYKGQGYSNTPCDFTGNGISEEAKNKIAKVRWNTGTFGTYDESEWTASATYQVERGDIDGKQYCVSQGGGSKCNDEVERKTIWDGYIGLMHPSDFGYAVGKSVREACLAKSMHDYYEDGCYEIDWLESSSRHEWTLNPVSDSSSASYVFQISFHGYLTADYSAESTVIEIPLIHPVIYLKSNVLVTGGTGSFEDPYIAS